MNIKSTYYVVRELIEKGIVSEEKAEAAALIINNEGKFNKEYQTKKSIHSYLTDYSSSIVKEADVEAVYSIIKGKFRDDAELTNEDIKAQAYNYLLKENKYSNFKCQANSLVESLFPSSNIYVKMFR
jgi:carbamoylphosphate synthase small subunit